MPLCFLIGNHINTRVLQLDFPRHAVNLLRSVEMERSRIKVMGADLGAYLLLCIPCAEILSRMGSLSRVS